MRRSFTALLIPLLVALSLLSAPAASAARRSFTFYGSGSGHGIGLSQWGSYGLALRGWSPAHILRHFYRGTRVGKVPTPSRIRVGLTSSRSVIHLTARRGPVRVWVGRPGRTLIGTIHAGRTWRVQAKGTRYRVLNDSGKVVRGRRWGGPNVDLFATFTPRGGHAFVPEADAGGSGYEYGRGYLEFNLTACAGGCSERLILSAPFEAYLYGLGEVPSSWPVASLRTQAIAARTYALYAMRNVGLRSSCNCHVYDDTSDQVYVGWSKESGPGGSRWVSAVRTTRRVAVSTRGAVIQAFYAASDGGHSENVEDVWHGGNPSYAISYLRGVCDPGEYTSANPYKRWATTYTARQVTSRLAQDTGSIGRVTGFIRTRRGRSGRIMTITVVGASGRASITGADLRIDLGLLDTRVWINSDRTITGGVRAKYDALMCAPGLPTSSVHVVAGGARQWFGRTGIYRNAKANVTVWLRGAVDAEYRRVGDAAGILGLPKHAPVHVRARTACPTCRRVDFQHGAIWAKPGAGANALWGRVYRAYLGRRGSGGPLGFPTTRPRRIANGSSRALFEHGSITCRPHQPSCTVRVT
jgi:SpoIID/LytB domain protein